MALFKIGILVLYMLIVLSIVPSVMAAWTMTSCTQFINSQRPTSDPNINVGGTFTMTAQVCTTGSGSGWNGPLQNFRYNTSGTRPNTNIPTSSGLSTADTNPGDCGAGGTCKGTCANFTITVTGSTAGHYSVGTLCSSTIGGAPKHTANQTVTVSTPPDNTRPSFYFNNTNTTSPGINEAIKFNINWTDNTGLSKNFFETNITGTVKNYSTSLSGVTARVNITNITHASLTGRFYWKSYTNDSSNNWNQTNRLNLTVISDSCTPPGSGDWVITDTCSKTNENINLASGGRVLILAGGKLICDRANVTAAGSTPTLIILGQGLEKLVSKGASNC